MSGPAHVHLKSRWIVTMQAEPAQDPDGAEVVFDHPTISLIEENLEPGGFSMFIGGTDAARDVALLRQHDIGIVVNCAVNLDINYVHDPREPADGELRAHGAGPLRHYKIGLVDGPGNSAHMMLGGYLLLDGAIRQEMPDKRSYPNRRKGNVLVHCRGGRSRSTALVALFLHLQASDRFPTLDAAIAHVRDKRSLQPDEWFSAPKPVLIDAARRAAETVRRLDLKERAEDR